VSAGNDGLHWQGNFQRDPLGLSEDMAAIDAPDFEYTANFWRKIKGGPRRTDSMMKMGTDRDVGGKRGPG